MSTLFIDSDAHMAAENLRQKYTVVPLTAAISNMPGTSNPAIELTVGSEFRKTLVYRDSIVQGFAWYTAAASSQGPILIWDHAGQQNIFLLWQEIDGTVSMYGRGVTPSLLIFNSGSVGFSLHANVRYDFQVKFSLSGTTNIAVTAELVVNNQTLGGGTVSTGLNVADLLNGEAKVNSYRLSASSGTTWIQPQYVFDTTGSFCNDYAGDCTFLTVFPDGDSSIQWTPSRAGTSWDLVNSNPPDPTKFVEDDNPTDLNTYTWQDIPDPLAGNIICAQYCILVQKTAEGSKSIKQTIDTGTDLSDEEFLPDDAVYFTFPMDVDPATGIPWIPPGFNATLFGHKVIT